MCQLKAGTHFKHKRKKVEELKELFVLIRVFSNAHDSVKNKTYMAVLMSVRLGMAVQAQSGNLAAASLIQQRAIKAGVLA